MNGFTVLAAVVLAFAAPVRAQSVDALKGLKLEIPATKFTLKNGLTLIVHEDHKAPIVAVEVWYKVGSRDEPAGRSGFAHLFEHLMFNGSEHSDTDWFKPVRAMGGTSINGTTNFDRTNYFQTVPKGALESILWLESDRMGHFLGVVSQAKLDEQRGVVQNEKRQGENRPYGKAYELTVKATYPAGHPYAHTTIGSMEDLDAARLEDVREWFRTWYGPSNAIVTLAGDITPAEALEKVERAFGHIPPGPPVARTEDWVAKREGTHREIAYDQVAQPRLSKTWNVTGFGARDTSLLRLAASALTGGRTSPLTKRLVHDEQVATSVYAYVDDNDIAGQFVITAEIKPDADVAKVEAAIDEELARLMKEGPRPAELDRARIEKTAQAARWMESVHQKAALLIQAEGMLGDSQEWRHDLDFAMGASAAEVRDAARRWLSDGVYVLTILPRPAYAGLSTVTARKDMPRPGETQAPPFPAFERAELANGMRLIVAPRRAAPMVNLMLALDTGWADADLAMPAGADRLTANLLDEGTASRTGLEISDALRGLGAELAVASDEERVTLSLSTLTPTLDPALALFADVTLNPAFRAEDIARVRKQAIVRVEADRRSPASAANRAMRALLFGAAHPYGRLSTEESLAAFTAEHARAYHKRWFTPENATLVVVGDTTLAEIRPKIEKAFAGWSGRAPARTRIADAGAAKPGLYLIDRPGSPQSYILGATPAPRWNAEDEMAITLLNDAFGGTFTSRLNMNLREGKGWSYGVRSGVMLDGRGPRLYQMIAPVQTDKTADSIAELRREFTELASVRPVSAEELAQVKNDTTLALPGRWETLSAVGSAIDTMVYRGLPDDYWTTLADRINATGAEELTKAAAQVVKPQDVVWVVVGDRAKIEPELAKKGWGAVTVIDADGSVVK
ncbi:MAG: M16 family metallopeptidase [Rhodospirillaceae bacterium]